MQINYWAVLVCGIVSMILGSIWYGPIFGKTWMRILGVKPEDIVRRKEMQKNLGPLYLVQFLLSLFQAYVLAHYIQAWGDQTGVQNSLWIWAGFLMPTVAGACMWNNDSKEISWTKFLIQAGYQLINLLAFGLILGYWR